MKENEPMDSSLDLIAGRFRVLGEPMRLKILHLLRDGEMSVGELVQATGANQANVSKHLGILLDAGLLARRKQGVTANYSVADPTIFSICDIVCSGLRSQYELRYADLLGMAK